MKFCDSYNLSVVFETNHDFPMIVGDEFFMVMQFRDKNGFVETEADTKGSFIVTALSDDSSKVFFKPVK